MKNYKYHFVCFKCRKTFKQVNTNDILSRIKKEKIYHDSKDNSIKKVGYIFAKNEKLAFQELYQEIDNREIKCPDCGGYMANLGLDFKAPKKSQIKEWRIVESLFRIGKSFSSCGCNGIGYVPQNNIDYKLYLEKIKKDYEESILFNQNLNTNEYSDKNERIKYWSEKLDLINLEINLLNY